MTMTNHAAEYAASVAAGIRSRTDAGYPFGYYNDEDDYHTDDATETTSDVFADGDSPWREGTASEWFESVLDFRYVVGSAMEYRGAQVFITLGGPNAYIDTEDHELVVGWGGDTARESLPIAFCEGLDDYLREMWEMSHDQ